MDARGHKRAACASLAEFAATQVVALEGGAGTGGGDEQGRSAQAWRELVFEMRRRGNVVHRAPQPTADTPALPFDEWTGSETVGPPV